MLLSSARLYPEKETTAEEKSMSSVVQVMYENVSSSVRLRTTQLLQDFNCQDQGSSSSGGLCFQGDPDAVTEWSTGHSPMERGVYFVFE